MPFKPKYNSAGEGLDRVLGTLERAVMEVLWRRKGAATVAAVHKDIALERDYHTVTTVMVRLCEKGLLHRRKKAGIWNYAPTLTREEFAARIARQLLEGVLDLAPYAAVASFVDLLDARAPDSLDMLEKLIDLKRAERKIDRP